ncbi:hypothetical protein K435DRAFT_899787 [Dendrothele bispora CBS 962.96]|uniref:Uncharacterized protein n=1 Tax=Dendrothele bispora (strain CBS 962.96) TaxID=1314807 RepID=A0A4S8LXV0_DENBC|nr:hypothetical protein K435DRAFT_899787 [Dendrothele bispora CBS 962.96]
MRFSVALVFTFAALVVTDLGVIAAPVQGNETIAHPRAVPTLVTRGGAQSKIVADLDKSKKCPTLKETLSIAHQLNGDLTNALFYSRVSLPTVQTVRSHYRKKYLQDVFPSQVFSLIRELCGHAAPHSTQDPLMLMSRAMAGIASGEAWVLGSKDSVTAGTVEQDGGPYFKAEIDMMRLYKRVHTLRTFYWDGRQLKEGHPIRL